MPKKAREEAEVGEKTALLEKLELDEGRFVELLGKLIGETKDHLINFPPDQVPQESKAEQHVKKALEKYCGKDGPLTYEVIETVKGRSNVIITYPGQQAQKDKAKTVAFVGSHFDVVPIANPDEWKRDPFTLTVEGDMLYGRGTTDCLGHVALQTELFLQLALTKPNLAVTVIGVLIADEEVGTDPEIGVEGLQKNGHLEMLKGGPVYWLDSADKMPCIGSGGVMNWKLEARGKGGHSGYPQKAVNSIELAMDAVSYLQKRFYADFSYHPKEKKYKFASTSSMKPTILDLTPGGLNQIKENCTIQGDIRLVPFFLAAEVAPKVEAYVEDFNKLLKSLVHEDDLKDSSSSMVDSTSASSSSSSSKPAPKKLSKPAPKKRKGAKTPDLSAQPGHCLCAEQFGRGPDSHYHVDTFVGSVALEWLGSPADGLAVDMDSDGYAALVEATEKNVGPVRTMADTGTLPLVAELKKNGLDVQVMGYGVEDAYHMDNEFARLSDFKQGFKVLASIIEILNDKAM